MNGTYRDNAIMIFLKKKKELPLTQGNKGGGVACGSRYLEYWIFIIEVYDLLV